MYLKKKEKGKKKLSPRGRSAPPSVSPCLWSPQAPEVCRGLSSWGSSLRSTPSLHFWPRPGPSVCRGTSELQGQAEPQGAPESWGTQSIGDFLRVLEASSGPAPTSECPVCSTETAIALCEGPARTQGLRGGGLGEAVRAHARASHRCRPRIAGPPETCLQASEPPASCRKWAVKEKGMRLACCFWAVCSPRTGP